MVHLVAEAAAVLEAQGLARERLERQIAAVVAVVVRLLRLVRQERGAALEDIVKKQ